MLYNMKYICNLLNIGEANLPYGLVSATLLVGPRPTRSTLLRDLHATIEYLLIISSVPSHMTYLIRYSVCAVMSRYANDSSYLYDRKLRQ